MGPTALITDGDQRAALAIVRSLGSAGYRCFVVSVREKSLAASSRWAAWSFAAPAPLVEPTAFGRRVVAHDSEVGTDLLIPVTEAALLALLPIRHQVRARIPFPDLPSFQAICDKKRVLETAGTLGIRVPLQTSITSPQDADTIDVQLPAVMKPHRSVYSTAGEARGSAGVKWVHTSNELEKALNEYPPNAYPLLIQEVIQGPGIGVFVLIHEGELMAHFAHRRIREKPPSGGVSVLRESLTVDPELLARSVALLEAFQWSGVAMVEYKRDQRSGEAVLMEINGRFWGSLQLAIDAGVDFPRLLADAALGRPVERVHTYRPARTRWFWGDVDHVLATWRDPRTPWSSKLASVAGLIRACGPGYSSEVFRWNDPGPFLHESKLWLSDALARH